MTQLTITDKLRNFMTLRSSDLQSDSDLYSIRNSCDVSKQLDVYMHTIFLSIWQQWQKEKIAEEKKFQGGETRHEKGFEF